MVDAKVAALEAQLTTVLARLQAAETAAAAASSQGQGGKGGVHGIDTRTLGKPEQFSGDDAKWAGCPGPPLEHCVADTDAAGLADEHHNGEATASHEVNLHMPWFFMGLKPKQEAEAMLNKRANGLAERATFREMTGSERNAAYARHDFFIDAFEDSLGPDPTVADQQFRAACKRCGSSHREEFRWLPSSSGSSRSSKLAAVWRQH